MEGLVFLAILVGLVPIVLPWVAIARTRHIAQLKTRVDGLERELRALRNALTARSVFTEPMRPHTEAVLPSPELSQRSQRMPHTDSSPRPDPSPELLPLPEPSPTPEPLPTAEPLPTPSPTAEASPEPSPTPEPSLPSPQAEPYPRAAEARPQHAPSPPVNWEQWVGVWGAASLAGIVIALAAILFFKYSIEHGLISPSLRVAMGTLVGIGCVVASTRLRRYEAASNSLAGGGAVVLYASFWAARVLYELVPMEATFVLMALTTATAALLAARYGSLLVAILGLSGGFLTPLLLASGHDRPVGLFAYLLLLDAGFLVVAYRRRWAGLALFALLGTLGIEAMWVSQRMQPAQLAIGLGATGLFALLFVATGSRTPTRGWRITQAAAVLLPHAFALVFSIDAHLGDHLYPAAALLLLLELAALWLAARDEKLALLPIGTAAGTVTVVGCWLARVTLSAPHVWEAAAVALALALPATLVHRRARLAALVHTAGLFAVLAAGAVDAARAEWAVVSGLSALALLAVAQAGMTPLLGVLAPAALGLALTVFRAHNGDEATFGPFVPFLLAELVLLIVLFVIALRRREPRGTEGVLVFGTFVLLGMLHNGSFLAEPAMFGFFVPIGIALVLVLAAVRRGHGAWLAAPAIPLALVHLVLADHAVHAATRAPLVALVAFALSVALFVAAPLVAWPRLRSYGAFHIAALAGLAWLYPSLLVYRDRVGTLGQGAVPLVYAAITLALVPSLRKRLDGALRTSALAWVAAGALALLSIAIPVELERQWITIGYALEACAVLLLWERLDHPGLKWFGVVLVGAVASRLVLNPWLLDYEARGSLPVFNWLLYTYWVPGIALFSVVRSLGRFELARLRPWEPRLRVGKDAVPQPVAQIFVFVCVLLIVFVWINLVIYDAFGTHHELTLNLERRPARDLTTSIAWIIYAIVLLALGVWRRSSGLRWASLGMMVVAIGKVFLYDLDRLHDLYRVGSLMGLAVSLLAVSLAYQRFVFRKEPS